MTMKNFASYCDTETRFHDTEEQAVDAALQCIQAMRDDTFDGWDELTTDNIVVMQVIRRAVKINPSAPYQNVDYRLGTIPEPHKWTQSPPTEQGTYWHWNGDTDCAPYPTFVLFSGFSGTCFVCKGQLGLERAIDCDKYGGWWMKLDDPKVPKL